MKAAIWSGTVVILIAIQEFCKAYGIILGGIPSLLLYGGILALAYFLSKKADK